MTADKEISCSDSNDSNKDSNSDNNGNTDSNSDSDDDDERDGNRGNPLGSNMAPLVASPPVFLLCRVLDTSNLHHNAALCDSHNTAACNHPHMAESDDNNGNHI